MEHVERMEEVRNARNTFVRKTQANILVDTGSD
jgi:hypothetical protein